MISQMLWYILSQEYNCKLQIWPGFNFTFFFSLFYLIRFDLIEFYFGKDGLKFFEERNVFFFS